MNSNLLKENGMISTDKDIDKKNIMYFILLIVISNFFQYMLLHNEQKKVFSKIIDGNIQISIPANIFIDTKTKDTEIDLYTKKFKYIATATYKSEVDLIDSKNYQIEIKENDLQLIIKNIDQINIYPHQKNRKPKQLTKRGPYEVEF